MVSTEMIFHFMLHIIGSFFYLTAVHFTILEITV